MTALQWTEDEEVTRPRGAGPPLDRDDSLWHGDDLLAEEDFHGAATRIFGDDPPAAWSWPDAVGRDSFIRRTRHRSSRGGSRPTRRSELGRWLAVALSAAVATLVTWQILLAEDTGRLEIDLARPEGLREVRILVDGVERCGTTPCILEEVPAGPHEVEVVSADGRRLRQRQVVRAGQRNLVSLLLPPR